jgi:hypothetical protein
VIATAGNVLTPVIFAEAMPKRPALKLCHDFKANQLGLSSPFLTSAPKPRAFVFPDRALGDPFRALTHRRHEHETPDNGSAGPDLDANPDPLARRGEKKSRPLEKRMTSR